jgi:hypothetical protein
MGPIGLCSVYADNSHQFIILCNDLALVDSEFECLRPDLPALNLNTTAASEHVSDIERQIHVIKERARDVRITLPFKVTKGWIIIDLIYYVALWITPPPPTERCIYGIQLSNNSHWNSF